MVDRRELSLIRFSPDRQLMIAVGAALLSIAVSSLMNVADRNWQRVILRHFLQVTVISTILPFLVLRVRREFREAAVRFDRPLRYVAISLIIAVLLAVQMGMEIGVQNIRITGFSQLEGAFYVMVTNVVEVFFFACFVRYYLEMSFGALPAIVIAAGLFSLHHAGFQPEYLKLFVVGLVFITILRLANHWLIAFPFWWIGGVFDVLFGSQATSAVDWSGFSIYALAIFAVIVSLFTWGYDWK